ncbi:MAG: hypothetical protein JNK48_02190 [Bryobacterales bacterium]|nr:hypothetical protein [Bryobacterales bacterium]
MLIPILAAIAIATDFEGGSLGRVEKVTETHWRLGSKGEKDQDGRNRQANWYSFRAHGLRPGQQLLFDIVDLPGEYNYKPNRGAITKDTPPVVSADGKTWRRLDTFEYDPAEPRLRLHVKAEGPSVHIAHVVPYTNEHLATLRRRLASSGVFSEEKIGKTVQGRDLVLWTLGPKKAAKTIWLMFRQHSWEAGSSWTGEGALLELAANAALRSDVTWKVFPLCDPDGVARGGVRFNAHGFDLNRNWDVHDPAKMPEITAQRNAIRRWLDAGNRIDLFYSLHNTETGEYLEGPPQGAQHHSALAERLFALLTKESTFHPSRPLFYADTTTTAGMKGRMTVIQGLWHEFRIPGFLMEQRIAHNERLGRLPMPEDRLKFGAELVRAMWKAVTAR